MGSQQGKRSYTVTCSSAFRDSVLVLADKRGANAADIARSVILVLPPETISIYPDPGGPGRDDRETVTLKSGPSAGRPWQRKPRLQVRMADGFDSVYIRCALGIALDMDSGKVTVELDAPGILPKTRSQGIHDLEEKVSRLNSIISVLNFEPLINGVETREEALHVLGYFPGQRPGMELIRSRFRTLAAIHHPDSDHGNHTRMSQLNDAMAVLRKY
ncbi:MAG: J domain-containing protein [Rhodospirillales bacterium]|jgi:hypothetical protein|nr:J domain-containing protein [Rhodospirillales bacterium]